MQGTKKELSREYLEAIFNMAKTYLTDSEWEALHQRAFPAAGGKARQKQRREREEAKVEYADRLLQAISEGNFVQGTSAEEPLVFFVGASPSMTDLAREQPLAGTAGRVFKTRYIKPLGLSEKQIAVDNIVPQVLIEKEDSTKARTPNEEEFTDWLPHIKRQIEKKKPKIVIALGHTTASALGDLAHFTLPHPVALQKLGDSGELDRKLEQIQKALEKALPSASHVHVPGPLNDEEEEATPLVLGATGGPAAFWTGPGNPMGIIPGRARGFRAYGPRFFELPEFPWRYIKEQMGKQYPEWTAENEEKISQKVHLLEHIYDHIKFEKIAYEKIWEELMQMSDPDNRSLAQMLEEMAGQTMQQPLLDTEHMQKVNKHLSKQHAIIKADEEKRLVYGVVLEPETMDAQEDIMSASEIEAAAHFYLMNSGVVGLEHSQPADAKVAESFIAPVTFEMGDQIVKEGSWIMAVKILNDETWQAVKERELNSFSVGGFGIREPIEEKEE